MDSLLLSSANQAAFVRVSPPIWTQDLKDRQQLDSSMSLTFFQELLQHGTQRLFAFGSFCSQTF